MLPRKSSKPQAEPPGGYQSRSDRELKRERINRIIEGIAENRPFWASEPPWIAEKFIEANGAKSQAESPFAEGNDG